MPGSTNFLQFNPTSANQQNDTTYLADSQRAGGAATNATFASALANKLFVQLSWFVSAFCQMMANKGFVMSDANYANLVAALTNVLTTADITSNNIITVPYSASPVFNASLGVQFYMLLTGDVTAPTFTNLVPGQKITVLLKQDGAGNHAFAWPSNMLNGGDPIINANWSTSQVFQVWPDGSGRAEGPPMASI